MRCGVPTNSLTLSETISIQDNTIAWPWLVKLTIKNYCFYFQVGIIIYTFMSYC